MPPTRPLPRTAPLAKGQIAARNPLEGVRVLFFYDDREYYDRFYPILEMCGLRNVEKHDSVDTAVNQLIANDYDLLIFTYYQNTEQSDQLLAEIRELQLVNTLPVVAITEREAGLNNILWIFGLGVDEIIWPPLSASKLSRMVDSVMQQKRRQTYQRELRTAEDLLESDKLDEARQLLEVLESRGVAPLEVAINLADLAIRQRDFPTATNNLNEAHRLAKEERNLVKKTYHLARVTGLYGSFYIARGRPEQAQRHLGSALSLNPHQPRAIEQLTAIHHEQGDVEAIQEIAQRFRKILPPFSPALDAIAQPLLDMAERYEQLGMQAKAREIFEDLYGLPCQDERVHLGVSSFLWRQERHSQVVRYLEEMAGKTRSARLSATAGLYLLKVEGELMMTGGNGEAPGPGDAADEVTEPDNRYEYFQGMGRSSLLDKSFRLFQGSLIRDETLLEGWIGLTCCYLRKGDTGAAEDALKRFMDSGEVDDKALLAVIEALMTENEPDLALDYIRMGIERYPEEVAFYLHLADYYAQIDKPFDGIGYLKEGLQRLPDQPELVIRVADMYQAAGVPADAVSFYERAVKLKPNDKELRKRMRLALLAKQQAG